MTCGWVQDRLLLYLAGELEPREAARLCRHLESCARCTAMAEELAETQELVEKALATPARAPATLDARVMESVRGLPSRRQPWPALSPPWIWQRRVAAGAAALSLLVGGYLAGHWHASRSLGGTAAQRWSWASRPHDMRAGRPRSQRPTLSLTLLGEDHLEYLADPQPAQVPGPDPRRVSLGLTPLLKFPVAAVDLQSEGARLLGGRKCQVQGVPIAFLLYDWKGERVSLYQIDGRKIALPPLRENLFHGRRFLVGEEKGLCYVAWRSGAMEFVMVSGVRQERLLHLACSASGMRESA